MVDCSGLMVDYSGLMVGCNGLMVGCNSLMVYCDLMMYHRLVLDGIDVMDSSMPGLGVRRGSMVTKNSVVNRRDLRVRNLCDVVGWETMVQILCSVMRGVSVFVHRNTVMDSRFMVLY